jgi:hypothetical protein
MKILTILAVLIIAPGAYAQMGHSNWIHRDASDTNVVYCLNDTTSTLRFPPGSMSGMMFPDSAYCQFELMCLDSLTMPSDSTMLGWCRVQLGEDSTDFNLMHMDGGMGHMGHNSMGFIDDVEYDLHWDSTFCDSTHAGWHMTGVMYWDGAMWQPVEGVLIEGSHAKFISPKLYSAYAFVGTSSVLAVSDGPSIPGVARLDQNYPNPFTASTELRYELKRSAAVDLKVFDMAGRQVATLVQQQQPAGTYTVAFNSGILPSGTYYSVLRVNGVVLQQSMTLAR